jgi:hypothetical protein
MSDVSDEELAQIAELEAQERRQKAEEEKQFFEAQLAIVAQMQRAAQEEEEKQMQIDLRRVAEMNARDEEEKQLQAELAQIAQMNAEDQEEQLLQLELARIAEQEAQDRKKQYPKQIMADLNPRDQQFWAKIIADGEEKKKAPSTRPQQQPPAAQQDQDTIYRLAQQWQTVSQKTRQKPIKTDVDDMVDALALLRVSEPERKGNLVSFCGPQPWVSIMSRPGWAAALRSESRPNMQNVCIRECGGEGDCLFYALGTAVAMSEDRLLDAQNSYQQMLEMRKWLAKSLNTDNIEDFLYNAQLEKYQSEQSVKHGDPGFWPTEAVTWKPDYFGSTRYLEYSIPGTGGMDVIPGVSQRAIMAQKIRYKYPFPRGWETKLDIDHPNFVFAESFVRPPNMSERRARIESRNKLLLNAVRKTIQTPGWTYPGDSDTLRYIVQSPGFRTRNLGILVIDDVSLQELRENNNNYTGVDCEVYPRDEPRDLYVLLFHLPGHWQLAGYAESQNEVQILIPRQDIPYVLRKLYKDKCAGMPGNLYDMTPDEEEDAANDAAR